MLVNFVTQRTSLIPSALSATQRRERYVLMLWTLASLLPLLSGMALNSPALLNLAIGIAVPGGSLGLPVGLFGLAGFMAALALHLATGNLILPVMSWVGLALWGTTGPNGPLILTFLPAAVFLLHLTFVRPSQRPAALPASAHILEPAPQGDVLAETDLPRLRLLLDRALQPVDQFRGFDHLDQFQTAALRYQVNFTAFSLAMAQARWCPAAAPEFGEAQSRLLAKLGEPKVWSYWRAEALWGHLSGDSDPTAKGNIMYSGFAALQMAVGGQTGLALPRLRTLSHTGETRLDLPADALAKRLTDQYAQAPFGLLACEPGWIYPICNALTACGLAAIDARTGSAHWARIAPRFSHHLQRDFTRADGRFHVVRSSITGFALPPAGGIVPEALTAAFLNPVLPDLALLHWNRVAASLRTGNLDRLVWPVDPGNYRLNRGAGLATLAFAAAEFGADDLKVRFLNTLDERHPVERHGASLHRPGVSLWAHALEMMAHAGGKDAFARLVHGVDRSALAKGEML
jgi:hypothetical protein